MANTYLFGRSPKAKIAAVHPLSQQHDRVYNIAGSCVQHFSVDMRSIGVTLGA